MLFKALGYGIPKTDHSDELIEVENIFTKCLIDGDKSFLKYTSDLQYYCANVSDYWATYEKGLLDFEPVEETEDHYENEKRFVFKHVPYGKFYALEVSMDSWDDDGNLIVHDAYEVLPTPVTTIKYLRRT